MRNLRKEKQKVLTKIRIRKNTLLIDGSYFLEQIGSTNKEKTINIVRNKQTNVHGV